VCMPHPRFTAASLPPRSPPLASSRPAARNAAWEEFGSNDGGLPQQQAGMQK